MGCLGNIIWMLCGGLVSALGYLIAGCIWCITIVGIPVGMQCFKFSRPGTFSVWKGCYIRWWTWKLFTKYHLGHFLWYPDCTALSVMGLHHVYHHNRYSVWSAAF